MIRVCIFDDARLYREGLALILERDPEVIVMDPGLLQGEVGDPGLQPDIALVRAHSAATIEAIWVTTGLTVDTKVIALGLTEREQDVIACAEAGVAGYLPREGSGDDLLALIHSVARGEAVCSPRIAASLLRRVATLAAERRTVPGVARLTVRELEIVRLIAEGLSNKEIARHLFIDVRTVKNHVHNILEKLQVHRRMEAVARVRAARAARTLD